MPWWKKIVEKILSLLSIAFKCKSDCCSCESECSNQKNVSTSSLDVDRGTTWSAKEEQNIMDFAKKLE